MRILIYLLPISLMILACEDFFTDSTLPEEKNIEQIDSIDIVYDTVTISNAISYNQELWLSFFNGAPLRISAGNIFSFPLDTFDGDTNAIAHFDFRFYPYVDQTTPSLFGSGKMSVVSRNDHYLFELKDTLDKGWCGQITQVDFTFGTDYPNTYHKYINIYTEAWSDYSGYFSGHNGYIMGLDYKLYDLLIQNYISNLSIKIVDYEGNEEEIILSKYRPYVGIRGVKIVNLSFSVPVSATIIFDEESTSDCLYFWNHHFKIDSELLKERELYLHAGE